MALPKEARRHYVEGIPLIACREMTLANTRFSVGELVDPVGLGLDRREINRQFERRTLRHVDEVFIALRTQTINGKVYHVGDTIHEKDLAISLKQTDVMLRARMIGYASEEELKAKHEKESKKTTKKKASTAAQAEKGKG